MPIEGVFETTGALLAEGSEAIESAVHNGSRGSRDTIPIEEARLLSPITENQQIVCQGKNYRQHAVETGFNPDDKPFNMFFRKASSCLCGARDAILRPPQVVLLDYEVELGLVVGRDVAAPERFDGPGLPDAVGALLVFNDVSARDVQVPQLQFYKGKSFRTFGPAGPWLTLVDDDVRGRWHELRLHLSVNEEPRQNSLAADMIHPPAATLSELSELQSLRTGDLIATGTPSGVAMQRNPDSEKLTQSLPARQRWQKFIEDQAASGRYLEPGDRVTAAIHTDDGAIDLGVLDNRVAGS